MRKRRQSLEKSMAVISGGSEPVVVEDRYRESLMVALNWYNFNWDEKAYRKAAEAYLKKMGLKEYSYILNKATFLEIRPIGALGRIATIGGHVSLDDVERIMTRLEKLKAKYAKQPVKLKAKAAASTPVLSIQERILEVAREHVGEFEGMLDEFITNGDVDFTAKGYLLSNQVSGAVSKRMAELLQPRLVEFQEVVTSNDKQLKEAYGHIRKPLLKKIVSFLEQMIADCNQQVVSAKAARKPRVKKAKPAVVIVKKLKYLKEYEDLKLKSIDPTKIIGSSELWVYNPEKRKLTVFYGADGGYLGVSGTSITNYDITKSQTKTIRKPEEFFKGLSMGKRALTNAWRAINGKGTATRPRINDGMVLLAVN